MLSRKKTTSLTFSLCLAYSAPHVTTIWLIVPLGIVQGVYAKYYGLSLTDIAAVILVARLFDAISDPLIGYAADNYHRRTGTRKPFMLIGGLLFIVSGYFLYVPPAQVGPAYFMCWFVAMYLAWTLFEVPHIAWASELAPASQDKTLIYSFRQVAGYAGVICFYSIPLLPFFETRDITPETLRVSVLAAGALMVLFLYYCLKVTPNSYGSISMHGLRHKDIASGPGKLSPQAATTHNEIHLLVSSLLANKPFLLFMAAFLFSSFASGMWLSLIFIYVDAYLGLGEQFAQMFMLAYVVGIAATPVWYKLAVWLGKRNVWVLSIVVVMFSFLYTATLTPGQTHFAELTTLKIVQTMGYACMGVVAPAALAEIADYGSWKAGIDRTATYFSLYTFLSKAGQAIAASVGLGIAGWYGFDAAATVHDEAGIWGLTLGISWIPFVLACLSSIFIVLSPLNVHRHAIIRRRLEKRRRRIEIIS